MTICSAPNLFFGIFLLLSRLSSLNSPGSENAGQVNAIELAPRDEWTYWQLAWALAETGRLEEALSACDVGLSLNPEASMILADRGDYLAATGRPEDAIEACLLALRMSPRDPINYWWENSIATAQFAMGRYDDARAAARSVSLKKPTHVRAAIIWAASAAAARQHQDSKIAIGHLKSVAPGISLDNVVPHYILQFQRPADAMKLVDCLALAGLGN